MRVWVPPACAFLAKGWDSAKASCEGFPSFDAVLMRRSAPADSCSGRRKPETERSFVSLFLQGVSLRARKTLPWFDMQPMYVYIYKYNITSKVFHVKHFAHPLRLRSLSG
jgi:hypothetical protein